MRYTNIHVALIIAFDDVVFSSVSVLVTRSGQ